MNNPNAHDTMCYLSAMQVIETWLDQGLIDDEQFKQIDTILGEKFSIPQLSVWRSINLLSIGE